MKFYRKFDDDTFVEIDEDDVTRWYSMPFKKELKYLAMGELFVMVVMGLFLSIPYIFDFFSYIFDLFS